MASVGIEWIKLFRMEGPNRSRRSWQLNCHSLIFLPTCFTKSLILPHPHVYNHIYVLTHAFGTDKWAIDTIGCLHGNLLFDHLRRTVWFVCRRTSHILWGLWCDWVCPKFNKWFCQLTKSFIEFWAVANVIIPQWCLPNWTVMLVVGSVKTTSV